MVFLIRSDTNPKVQYRCDLLANKGAGRCACIDFATRRQPKIDAGAPAWTADTVCRHTKRAAWHLLRLTLADLAAKETRSQ